MMHLKHLASSLSAGGRRVGGVSTARERDRHFHLLHKVETGRKYKNYIHIFMYVCYLLNKIINCNMRNNINDLQGLER